MAHIVTNIIRLFMKSLLIVVWAKAICKGFRHLIWLMKYKASEKKAKKEAK